MPLRMRAVNSPLGDRAVILCIFNIIMLISCIIAGALVIRMTRSDDTNPIYSEEIVFIGSGIGMLALVPLIDFIIGYGYMGLTIDRVRYWIQCIFTTIIITGSMSLEIDMSLKECKLHDCIPVFIILPIYNIICILIFLYVICRKWRGPTPEEAPILPRTDANEQ